MLLKSGGASAVMTRCRSDMGSLFLLSGARRARSAQFVNRALAALDTPLLVRLCAGGTRRVNSAPLRRRNLMYGLCHWRVKNGSAGLDIQIPVV